jgi:radical SAM superfamily enzyme YgiQ (UPF0313 family)
MQPLGCGRSLEAGLLHARFRAQGEAMPDPRAVIVAFLEQDNLGVGYLASVLLQNHIDVSIVDFCLGRRAILEHVLRTGPSIVGFSIIFQYHIHDFRDLMAYLRTHGVRCHFTAGGHYPSLRYADLLEMIPELDSVVLFEGEYTFLELVRSSHQKQKWKSLKGIAYRQRGYVVANPLRPLESDLDRFPPPVRQPLKECAFGKKYATILAGRGCYHNCAFCSVRQFYSRPPGPVKRVRRPEMVVAEMELLHRDLGCSVFLFQDDDFPVAGRAGERWAAEFCDLLVQKDLHRTVMWKISCRSDEVQTSLFRRMKEAGLFFVYMGIEDGTDEGLALMNKHVRADTNCRAVDTLKKLGIEYDFGFMLFHPDSTFRSISQNLDFLERICGDGSSPITFGKMLPYAETQVECKLRNEGRLKGPPGFEDYDFAHPSLDSLYCLLAECFREWVSRPDGLLNLTRWARYSLGTYHKYYRRTRKSAALGRAMRECIAQSNRHFIETARGLTAQFESEHNGADAATLVLIRNTVAENHAEYKRRLIQVMDDIRCLAE